MNLEKETRRGYVISAEMKKVWAVEIELLKKLLYVCEKNHLRVWAEGGTLLGTVREKGYIPWDDDIDMAMPRKDYDILRNIAEREFQAPYFFQCGFTDLFPNGFTRIRMDGTTAVLRSSIFQKYHQGIFIDVFPLDIIPSDKMIFKEFQKKRMKERIMLKLYCEHHFSFCNLKYDWNVLKSYFLINKVGFNQYFHVYDDLMKSFSNESSDLVSIVALTDELKYIRQKSWYQDTKYLPFEDLQIPVPSGFDEILKKQYGDYMVPTKVPTMHGGFLVLDTEHSYKDYLPTLQREHRWANWTTRYKQIKKILKKVLKS